MVGTRSYFYFFTTVIPCQISKTVIMLFEFVQCAYHTSIMVPSNFVKSLIISILKISKAFASIIPQAMFITNVFGKIDHMNTFCLKSSFLWCCLLWICHICIEKHLQSSTRGRSEQKTCKAITNMIGSKRKVLPTHGLNQQMLLVAQLLEDAIGPRKKSNHIKCIYAFLLLSFPLYTKDK